MGEKKNGEDRPVVGTAEWWRERSQKARENKDQKLLSDTPHSAVFRKNVACPLLPRRKGWRGLWMKTAWQKSSSCDFPELRERLPSHVQEGCACFGSCGNECVLRHILTSERNKDNGNKDHCLNVVQAMSRSEAARYPDERVAMKNIALSAVDRFGEEMERLERERLNAKAGRRFVRWLRVSWMLSFSR